MIKQLNGDLYDYPAYYDLVFGSDCRAEFQFLKRCFDKHADIDVRRLFEPACGTGRLLHRLARAGFDVLGLDLNPRAVEYCNDRLARQGFPRSALVGDMTDFRLPTKVDAAFNMINSFRHLSSEQAATDHLRCMARALNSGGLYVLGLHLTPTVGRPMEHESWSARRGHLCVNTSLRTTRRDPRRRRERFLMTLDVHTPSDRFRLTNDIVFRTYTAAQFDSLVARVEELRIVETYDFAYDVNSRARIDEETEDVVYVIKRR